MPSGISPSFSTTKRGGAERDMSLRSANRRGSSGGQEHVSGAGHTKIRDEMAPLSSGGGRSSSRTTGMESTSSIAVLVARSSVI